MHVFKLANANASVIAVTATATTLKALLDAAAGETNTKIRSSANAVDLMIEDGDVRVLMDGNTPTASKGILLKQGSFIAFRNVPFANIKLIRVGGSNVAVSAQVGECTEKESSSFFNLVTGAVTLNEESAGRDADNDVMKVEQRFTPTRVQNVTTEQTITARFLKRIIIATGVTGKTITVKDGDTTLGVITTSGVVPQVIEFDAILSTSLKVTPNDAGLDLIILTA